MRSKLELFFETYITKHQIIMDSEIMFHPKRKWRFDFADQQNKIAVELEGGIWINGRHNRGGGFADDTEKYNEALVMGWRVLRYVSIATIQRRFLDDYARLRQL